MIKPRTKAPKGQQLTEKLTGELAVYEQVELLRDGRGRTHSMHTGFLLSRLLDIANLMPRTHNDGGPRRKPRRVMVV